MLSWQGLPQELRAEYAVVRVLKRTDQKEHVLLEHTKNGSRRLLCNYCGEPLSIYTLLLQQHLPHLPYIYNVYPRENGYSVLEEFIEGTPPTLPTSATPMQIEVILNDMHQLCDALGSLHALGIVHRDVKPENILKTSDGTLYLVDFDAARQYKAYLKNDTCLMGTTGYAAPEQFGLLQTDCRADIFALGVTLNVLLTGCHPSQMLYKGALREVILHCTHIDPDDRYQTTAAVWRALAPYLFFARINCNVLPHYNKKVLALIALSACFCLILSYLVLHYDTLFFKAIPAVASAVTSPTVATSSASNADVSQSAQSQSSSAEKPALSEHVLKPIAKSTQKNAAVPESTPHFADGIFNWPHFPSAPVPSSFSDLTSSGSVPDKPILPPASSSDKPISPPASSSNSIDITQKPGYAEVKVAYDNFMEKNALLRERRLALEAAEQGRALFAEEESALNEKYLLSRIANEDANAVCAKAKETLNAYLAAQPIDQNAVALAQTAVEVANRVAEKKLAEHRANIEALNIFAENPEYIAAVQATNRASQLHSTAWDSSEIARKKLLALQEKYNIYF